MNFTTFFITCLDVSDEIEYYGKPYKLDGCLLNIEQLYEEIRPLYLNLHSYVRKILRAKYGSVTVSHDGPIPVHLLGTVFNKMYSQNGGNKKFVKGDRGKFLKYNKVLIFIY